MNELKDISKGRKLRKITEHYGYVKRPFPCNEAFYFIEIIEAWCPFTFYLDFGEYFIFNIVGGYIVSAMKKRQDAIRECKYLEKLVYDKEIKDD